MEEEDDGDVIVDKVVQGDKGREETDNVIVDFCQVVESDTSDEPVVIGWVKNKAWGCLENLKNILEFPQEDDKEALHRLLGIKDRVKPVLTEFIINKNGKKRRGRPPKKPDFEGGVLKSPEKPVVIKKEEDDDDDDDVKIICEPSKEEVQAFLQDIKHQIEAKGKRRGRRLNFDVYGDQEIKVEPTETKSKVVAPPKKRGRPPIPNKPVKICRPRGRPRKPRTIEDLMPKVPKKRGRPPKPKTAEDLLPKVPKKRGRPPKFIALEELGVPVIYEQVQVPDDNKAKMIYTYKGDSAGNNQAELLDMISSGLMVVDVTEKNLPKRGRGRPPKDPNRPPPAPKVPRPPTISAKGRILGRPKKGCERPKEDPKEKKSRGRPKKPVVETEDKVPKKRGRPKKIIDPSLKATLKQIQNVKIMKQWSAKYRSKHYVSKIIFYLVHLVSPICDENTS